LATRNFIPLTNIGIDGKQEKRLNFLFGLIAALSGIAAIMIFVDNRRHSKVQEEILDLDKELKLLQIKEIKNGNS
jgi:uncharacterized protein YjfI (DUF2170 family)